MIIENNILKYHLQNVYWIGGTACGGKTTAAKALAERHNLYHYNADEKFNEYRKIATHRNQPNLSKKFYSAYDYFTRPINEYIEYLDQINRESFDMMVIDLIKISVNKRIIVEGHYPADLIKEVAAHNNIAFLYANENIIRRDYFTRNDKQDMLDSINKVSDSEKVLEHVFKVIVKSAQHQLEAGKKMNYALFERTEDSTLEELVENLEKHFKLFYSLND